MNRATVYRVDGTIEELGHKPTLKEAQEIVGGYIELVKVRGKVLVVDDEGKLEHKNKPTNKLITSLYGSQIYSGYVVGDVIVLEGWKSVA